jgi:catechol 2,3-dioxygenase-like lactoylglutathione lyase family enzyme
VGATSKTDVAMAPRIHVITLGVEDLDRALRFYRSLGWRTEGIVGTEFTPSDAEPGGAIVPFQLQGGLLLSLYERTNLSKDSNTALPRPPGAFSLGHIVSTREAVDEVLALAQAAGGRVTEPARDRPWGIYSGYFSDSDGHLWEIIWNPSYKIPAVSE